MAHTSQPARTIEQSFVGDSLEQVSQSEQVSAEENRQVSTGAGSDFAGFAANPAGGGYWVVSKDGGVTTADVGYHGGMNGKPLNGNIVGVAATSTGNGYWLVGSDGGIFSFGDATFYGSMGASRLNRPIIGMSATTTGRGYWLFASDGGIFSFGDAQFYGSTGGMTLNAPIVGMTPSKTSDGYWLVARDGGVFAFHTDFFGSMGGQRLNAPVVGTLRSDSGDGYWQVASDGGIFSFGDAQFYGSLANRANYAAIIGLASRAAGQAGYVIVRRDGSRGEFGPGAASSDAPDACAKRSIDIPPINMAFSFSRTFSNGSPHRFSPCEDVHWVISNAAAPVGAEQLLREAFDKAEASTGLNFVFDGWTSERVSDRVATMNYVDGSRWKPIIVDFGNEGDSAMCGSAGCGYMYTVDGVIVSGALIMNRTLPMQWGVSNGLGEIAIHEIGHVVGLGHIDDRAEVMYRVASTLVNYHDGDLRGLWLVGVGSAALPQPHP